LENSLKVTFFGDTDYSQFTVRFVSLNCDTPYALYEMELNEFASGEITLPNNEDNYDNVVMFVSDSWGGTGTVEYSFIAEDVISQVPVSETDIPSITNLSCYPNPFNPLTTISYSLATDSYIKLNIHNTKGQIVKQLLNTYQQMGDHSITWDGTNDIGKPATSGLYFYQLITPTQSITQKTLLLK
jgi:hypothetical protein